MCVAYQTHTVDDIDLILKRIKAMQGVEATVVFFIIIISTKNHYFPTRILLHFGHQEEGLTMWPASNRVYWDD